MNYPEHLKDLTVVYFSDLKNNYWYAFCDEERRSLSSRTLPNLIGMYEDSTTHVKPFMINHTRRDHKIIASAPLHSFAELYPEHLL